MVDFGYQLSKDRQIDYDKNNKDVINYVISKEPSIKICISCGTCTATCSAGNFTDFNLRRLFSLIKRGEHKEAKENIDKCMLCGKCILACPRGVNTRNVILTIQKALTKYNKISDF